MSYLRLSEAIMAGDVLLPREHTQFLSGEFDGDNCKPECGCALGRAWLAAGRTFAEWANVLHRDNEGNPATVMTRTTWPWVTEWHTGMISIMFDEVCNGGMTIEQLADRVREWEEELDPNVRTDKSLTQEEQVGYAVSYGD